METIILTLHIILALCITGLVLLQRSEGGALGSLGGSQSASSMFTGRQAGTILSRLTAYLFASFIITSLTLVIMSKNTMDGEKISLIPESATQTETAPTPSAE